MISFSYLFNDEAQYLVVNMRIIIAKLQYYIHTPYLNVKLAQKSTDRDARVLP